MTSADVTTVIKYRDNQNKSVSRRLLFLMTLISMNLLNLKVLLTLLDAIALMALMTFLRVRLMSDIEFHLICPSPQEGATEERKND